MVLRFSQNHVPLFSRKFLMPSTMFFRFFSLAFDRACKDGGHPVVRFLKNAFFMPEKSRPKNLHADFWPFFEDLNLWKRFCAYKLTFQKSDDGVPSAFACSIEW